MPSTSNPTGGKVDHLSSLRLEATSTLSGSRLTPGPLDQQSSVTPLESFFPQKYENRQDELIVPLNYAVATQRFNSSTSAHTSETRGVRDLEGNEKGVGPNEQVSEEMEGVTEGKEVTRVPCAHPHPAPLTFIQTEAAGEPIRVAARTSSSSTTSWSTSSSTTSWSTSMSPYMSMSTPSLSKSTIPFPHSFASASYRSLTTLSPKKQHAWDSALPTPFRSISITQNRSPKIQIWRFTPPPANSPTTPPFQQRWPNFYSTYPSPKALQLCRDDQGIPKEPPPRNVVHNMSDTSSLVHGFPSISLPASPPWTFRDRSDQVFVALDYTSVAQGPCNTTLIHANSDAMDLGDSKDNTKVVGIGEQDAREVEAAVEEQGSSSGLVMAPTRTSSPLTASWSTSAAPCISNFIPNLRWESTILFSPLRSRPSMPTFPQRQCLSLPPSIRQLKSLYGQQLLGTQPSTPMVGERSRGPSSTSEPASSRYPLSTEFFSNSCQQQHTQGSVLFTPYSPSIANIDDQLCTHFLNHPKFLMDESCEPAIHADAPIDKLRSFADVSDTQNADDNDHILNASCSNTGSAIIDSISSLPICMDDSDDRSMTSSTVSLEPSNGLDALQRGNVDLDGKGMEVEHERLPPKEPALPTTVDNTIDTPLSMHSAPSISLHHLSHEYSVSLHPHPSTSISPKQWCSFLSPPFCRLEHFRARQLLRSQSCILMVGKGSCSSLFTPQLAPSPIPLSTTSSSISCQRQHDTQNQHSRTLAAHGVPTVESQVCSLPPTLDSHTLLSPSNGYQPNPNARDEQMQLEAVQLPAVPIVDNEGYPSSTMRNSYLTPFPAAPSSSPSTLSDTAPPSQIYENHLGEITALTGNEAAQYLGSSTSIHISDAREPRNLKDEARVVGIDEQDTKEIKVAAEGDEVTMVPCACPCPTQLTSFQASRTLSPSTESCFTSPFPLLFTSASSRLPTHSSSKEQCIQQSVLATPIHSLSTTRKRSSNIRTRRFALPPVNPPTTPPFQRRPLNFYPTCPSSDTLPLYQAEQSSPREPPLPVVVDDASDTSLLIRDRSSSNHNALPVSPPPSSDNFCQYQVTFRSRPRTPVFSQRRCSSLPPPFCQLKNICGQQLLRTQPSAPMVRERGRSPSSACKPTPSRYPLSTEFFSNSHQRQLNTQNEHMRILPRAAAMVENEDYMSPLTPNAR